MHAMIMHPTGARGPLSRYLTKAIEHGKTTLRRGEATMLRTSLKRAARKRLDEVLCVWTNAEYGCGLAGPILKVWARDLSGPKKRAIVTTAVKDAMDYVSLFSNWKLFVDAMLRLTPRNADWLFYNVEDC